ncbi:MAG: phosphatase PAP2 family protein [Alistipes sp.]|nr:phosphatase PAP2 family protein [Alistipes sp.]
MRYIGQFVVCALMALLLPSLSWATVLDSVAVCNVVDVAVKRDSVATDASRCSRGWWQEHSDNTTRFRPRQLIAPVTLFTVGAVGVGVNSPMYDLNRSVRDAMNEWRGDCYMHFDDYLQYCPVALYLGLAATPARSKHTFAERVCVAAVTYISVTALTNALKYSICSLRPDGSARNSFPSGHTATAFAGAELVRSEYGWGYGLAAYLMASTVGFMRVYNNRHWVNDVLGGAAVGIISARIGYWLLPLSRKIFHLKSKTVIAATPVYFSENGSVGLSCSMCF